MCFVWISEQTAIISLYRINWLVFIIETECVYCAVRTGYLYIMRFHVIQHSGVRTSQPLSVLYSVSLLPLDCVWSVCLPRSGLSKAAVFAVRCSREARVFRFSSASQRFPRYRHVNTWHTMDYQDTFSGISRKHVTVVDRLRDGFVVNWPLSWRMCPTPAPKCSFAALICLCRSTNRFAYFYFILLYFPGKYHWMGSMPGWLSVYLCFNLKYPLVCS